MLGNKILIIHHLNLGKSSFDFILYFTKEIHNWESENIRLQRGIRKTRGQQRGIRKTRGQK